MNIMVMVCRVLCIGLFPVLIAAQEPVSAKITRVVGKVEVRSKASTTWRSARIGMTVKEQWDIRAYMESEAEVTFVDGTILRIGENSVVNLSRMKADAADGSSQSTVKVLSGKLWGNVKKLTGTQSEFDFETPTAVASIRGTRLGIDVGKKKTTVDVYEGKVFVRRKNSSASAMVTNNNRAIINRAGKEVTVIDFKSIGSTGNKGGGNPPPADPFAGQTDTAADTAAGNTTDTTAVLPADVREGTTPDTGFDTGDSTGGPAASQENGMGAAGASPDTQSNQTDKNTEVSESPASQRLLLTVTAPGDGSKITQPLIVANGKTVPGAKVFINEMQVAVGGDGTFTGRIPVPDEPYAYTVEIRAEIDGKERTVRRLVTYEPKAGKLFIECASPADGQTITSRSVRINGKTLPGASVAANGIPVNVAANGVFSGELPLTEMQIGDYQLEMSARNDNDEVTRTFNLEISGASPQINTSAPVCLFSLQGHQATTRRTVPVQLLDRTPGDELVLTIVNNGSVEKINSEPGRTENLILNEGRNDYSLQATDRAGNVSAVIQGTLNYLPGPLILLLNEPSRNPMIYDGVPPVLHPGRAAAEEPIDVEVEIDDGIGTVPATIKYCRVTGNGKTLQLRNNNDYIYRGKVNIRRGTNQFVIQVEDLTGRLEQLRFEVIVR